MWLNGLNCSLYNCQDILFSAVLFRFLFTLSQIELFGLVMDGGYGMEGGRYGEVSGECGGD
jgi:hypothetical protein